jgi:hypothetical protein
MLGMSVGGGSLFKVVFWFGKADFKFFFWKRLVGLRQDLVWGLQRLGGAVEFTDLDWGLVGLRLKPEVFGFWAEKVVSHLHLHAFFLCF